MEIGSKRNVPGKLIDTWIYKIKDVTLDKIDYTGEDDDTLNGTAKVKHSKERIVNKTVKVEIIMEKTTRQSEEAPHPLDRVKLHAYCRELGVHIEGTDVESLRAAMWAYLDDKFKINWEPYYIVSIERDRYRSGDGTSVILSYDTVYKGTTHDGKVLMRIWRYRDEKIEPWPGEFKDEKGKVQAVIQGTEENQAALESFKDRLDLLREKLKDFLRPENIQQTLNNLNALRLLPEPEPHAQEKDQAE